MATMAARRIPSKVLVAGAGAIGLRTALELCRRDIPVVVRAPKHPVQQSCSRIAGGYWMPYRCDDVRVDRWALETLDELLQIADKEESSSSSTSSSPLVELVSAIILKRENSGPDLDELVAMSDEKPDSTFKFPQWTTDPRIAFQHLTVEMLSWQNKLHRLRIPPEQELKDAGYLYAWLFQSPIVNSPQMLQHFLTELETVHGTNVNVETGQPYQSLKDLQESAHELGCDMVINATGMGARSLVPDPSVVPARGVLLQFDRKSCVRRPPVLHNGTSATNIHDVVITVDEPPFGSATHPAYMIPRGSTLVVGGTYLEGDEEPHIRDEERQQLVRNAINLGIDMDATTIREEAVGFRPFRSPVRCEFDTSPTLDPSIPIFHSYGHGGSGWTINVGAARECADMILGTK